MKKLFRNFPVGSAEYVLAHAAWRRSRGRTPSMGYLTERNPTKALKSAKVLQNAHKNEALTDQLSQSVGPALVVQRRSYVRMSKLERKVALRALVTTSSSKEEIEQRLERELCVPQGLYMLSVSDPPNDPVGIEARDLVRGLGGLITKSGCMVMIMIMDDYFDPCSDDEGGPPDFDFLPHDLVPEGVEPEPSADGCYDPTLLSRYGGGTTFRELLDSVLGPVMA